MKVREIKPDSFDREQLREVIGADGYKLIADRTRKEIERQKQNLLTIESWENVRYIQGFAAGLVCALEIPAILSREIQEREARK